MGREENESLRTGFKRVPQGKDKVQENCGSMEWKRGTEIALGIEGPQYP